MPTRRRHQTFKSPMVHVGKQFVKHWKNSINMVNGLVWNVTSTNSAVTLENSTTLSAVFQWHSNKSIADLQLNCYRGSRHAWRFWFWFRIKFTEWFSFNWMVYLTNTDSDLEVPITHFFFSHITIPLLRMYNFDKNLLEKYRFTLSLSRKGYE